MLCNGWWMPTGPMALPLVFSCPSHLPTAWPQAPAPSLCWVRPRLSWASGAWERRSRSRASSLARSLLCQALGFCHLAGLRKGRGGQGRPLFGALNGQEMRASTQRASPPPIHSEGRQGGHLERGLPFASSAGISWGSQEIGAATSPFVPAGRLHTSLRQQQLDWPEGREAAADQTLAGLASGGNQPQLRLNLWPLPEPLGASHTWA